MQESQLKHLRIVNQELEQKINSQISQIEQLKTEMLSRDQMISSYDQQNSKLKRSMQDKQFQDKQVEEL